jgi:hypothetical protein
MWNATGFDLASTNYRQAYAHCFGRAEYDPHHTASSEEMGHFVMARRDLILALNNDDKHNASAIGASLEAGDIDLFTYMLDRMTPQEAWVVMEMREMPIGRSARFLSDARDALIAKGIQIPTKLNNALIRAAFRDKDFSMLRQLGAPGGALDKAGPSEARPFLLQSFLRGLAGYDRGPVPRLVRFLEEQIGSPDAEEAWHEALCGVPLTWKLYLALAVCGFHFTEAELERARELLKSELRPEQMQMICGSNHIRLKLLALKSSLPKILALDEAACTSRLL